MLTAMTVGPALAPSSVTVEKLIQSFLSGRNRNTLRSYATVLQDFTAFLNAGSFETAARQLLSGHPGEANALVLDYQASLQQRGLSSATINHRLSAVRSLVKLARMLGLIPWSLEISNLRSQPYRDTRGPGQDGVRRMLQVLAQDKTPKSYRDAALIHLLYDRGLRRGEVAALDLGDVNVAHSRLRIHGKGRTEPEWLGIPPVTLEAIADWLVFRGLESGPLFHNLDAAMPTGRLSTTGIYWIVRSAAERAGLGHVRPHGLRHAAITCALDKTNGNVRAAAKFARHKRLDTTMIYDDARQDLGGEISKLIAGN